jgi:hypothetical protein
METVALAETGDRTAARASALTPKKAESFMVFS